MLGSAAIEMMIGLVTLYLLLSTVCSAAAEWAMHKFRPRSGLLRETLIALFSPKQPGAGAAANPIMDFVLSHGLVRPIPGNREQSYVSARGFALAVVDALIPDTGVKGALAPGVAEIRDTASKLPDSPIKDAVLAFLDRAGSDLNSVTESIEAWYADTMDRVAGIYKRNVQLVLFVIGFVLAIVINADTFMIVRVLASDPQTRAAVVQQAVAAAAAGAPAPAKDPQELEHQLKAAQTMIAESSFPLGWTSDASSIRAFPWQRPPHPSGDLTDSLAVRFAGKLLGILITAAAVSFGAPFWFDLLNKVTNLRAAGPKPADPNDGGKKPDGGKGAKK